MLEDACPFVIVTLQIWGENVKKVVKELAHDETAIH
jgi:hypothetical protein